MAGKYFGQWSIGDRVEHGLRRTVTETDNLLFSSLTHNGQSLGYDAEAEAALGRPPVTSCFTFGLLVSVSGNDTTLGTMRANLGFDKVITPNPVYVGDTLRAESEVTDLRASRSRPGAGIVIFRHRMLNQRDQIVCQCLRAAMVDHEPARGCSSEGPSGMPDDAIPAE
jgi:acyl dehydratase